MYKRQEVVESVNNSIEDTVEALDVRFIQRSVENLELISVIVDPKQIVDTTVVKSLADKYPSFVNEEKLQKEMKYLKETKSSFIMLSKLEVAGVLSANYMDLLPLFLQNLEINSDRNSIK